MINESSPVTFEALDRLPGYSESPIITDPSGIAILRRALEWATDQKAAERRGEVSEWDQTTWCGTSHCLAGQIALLDGCVHDSRSLVVDGATGREMTAAIAATEALGVQRSDGARWSAVQPLWAGMNGLSDPWSIASKLTGGAITVTEGI